MNGSNLKMKKFIWLIIVLLIIVLLNLLPEVLYYYRARKDALQRQISDVSGKFEKLNYTCAEHCNGAFLLKSAVESNEVIQVSIEVNALYTCESADEDIVYLMNCIEDTSTSFFSEEVKYTVYMSNMMFTSDTQWRSLLMLKDDRLTNILNDHGDIWTVVYEISVEGGTIKKVFIDCEKFPAISNSDCRFPGVETVELRAFSIDETSYEDEYELLQNRFPNAQLSIISRAKR